MFDSFDVGFIEKRLTRQLFHSIDTFKINALCQVDKKVPKGIVSDRTIENVLLFIANHKPGRRMCFVFLDTYWNKKMKNN